MEELGADIPGYQGLCKVSSLVRNIMMVTLKIYQKAIQYGKKYKGKTFISIKKEE